MCCVPAGMCAHLSYEAAPPLLDTCPLPFRAPNRATVWLRESRAAVMNLQEWALLHPCPVCRCSLSSRQGQVEAQHCSRGQERCKWWNLMEMLWGVSQLWSQRISGELQKHYKCVWSKRRLHSSLECPQKSPNQEQRTIPKYSQWYGTWVLDSLPHF